MKKIYLTTIMLALFLLANAQVQFGGAIQYADFSELNSNFLTNNTPSLENELYSFSIISAKEEEDKKWVNRFGFMFNWYETNDAGLITEPNFNELNLRTLGIVSGTGYNFINSKNFSIGPSIDFLFIENRMRIIENLPAALTLGNIIANEVETQEFRNFRLMFQGNFNLLYKFNNKNGNTQYGLGITGGYRWDPFEPEWRFDRTRIKVNIPGSKQSGFLFGLMFSIKGPDFMPQKPKSKEERS